MNKIVTMAAIAVLSLGAAACSGCQPLERLNQPIAGQTVFDEKAMYAAEAGLFGANTAAEAAVDNGLLKAGSPEAVKIADGLVLARRAVNAGWQAYRLGDAASAGAKLVEAQRLIADVWALIPPTVPKEN